jgi:copper chaperone NosL
VRRRAFIAVVLALSAGCASGRPATIAYGEDTCTRCHMLISDRRFGAVIVTRQGRSLEFDSIECLRAYYAQPGVAANVASMWVADFANPGAVIAADRATYVDVGARRSPMGTTHGWAAVTSAAAARAVSGDAVAPTHAWSELP